MLFDDGKEPGALRTIGEVATALGIRQHVLRYWEEQFPMLRPVKRSGGRRYYRPDDVALVARIDRLVHKEGYTLRGARAVIAGDPKGEKAGQEAKASAVPSPAPAPVQSAQAQADLPLSRPSAPAAFDADQVERLRAIRTRLAAALSEG